VAMAPDVDNTASVEGNWKRGKGNDNRPTGQPTALRNIEYTFPDIVPTYATVWPFTTSTTTRLYLSAPVSCVKCASMKTE